MLGGTLGVAVVLLVACPAANNAGNGGGGPGPGGGTGQPYVCDNGTPVGGTTDTTGQTRCESCNRGYRLENGSCRANNYVCANGTLSSLRDATTDGLSRCVSCDHPLFFELEGSSDAIGTTCRTVAEVGGAVRIGLAMQFGVGESLPYDLAAIGDTLYMVGHTNDVLYTLDTATGSATRESDTSVRQFGVSEDAPTGLAAISGTLYKVGWDGLVLYTLNIDDSDGSPDGMAYPAGSTSRGFGVSESAPTGLAAIRNTLYMVGAQTDDLYTLNIDPDDSIDDGRAIQVGSVTDFGVGEGSPTGLAAIGDTLYMVGASNDALYTLDTTTGRATQVGSVAAGFGVSENVPRGLAAIGNTLYMVGSTHDALYALRYQ